MRYDDRVKILTTQEIDGPLGKVRKDVVSDWLPCKIAGMTDDMNMSVFGKYNMQAQAIHFKNDVGPIAYVLVDGVKRLPKAIKATRKNTVVIVGQ